MMWSKSFGCPYYKKHPFAFDLEEYICLDKHLHPKEIAFYNNLLSVTMQDGHEVPYTAYVYNIEVEDYHTYFVTKDGYWIHDVNCFYKVY